MSELTARVVGADELTREEAARWDAWCGSDPALDSPFYSRQFTTAVASVRADVQVCMLFRDGEAVGFLPFQFRNRTAQVFRFAERVGAHLSDYFGLIAQPSLVLNDRQLLALAKLSGIEFSHLDGRQRRHGLVGQASGIGIRYDFSKGAEAYWQDVKARDSGFYGDTQRKQRRIERDIGPLRFTYEAPAGELLDQLIAMKREQYARTNVADALSAAWTRRLLLRLARTQHELCTGVLSTLHAGDKLVAMHFGLRGKHCLHIWFPVYDPTASNYSPGRLLLKALIDTREQTGLRTLDDGEATPGQQQKRQMGNFELPLYKGEWLRPGALSTLARAERSLRRRFRALRSR